MTSVSKLPAALLSRQSSSEGANIDLVKRSNGIKTVRRGPESLFAPNTRTFVENQLDELSLTLNQLSGSS